MSRLQPCTVHGTHAHRAQQGPSSSAAQRSMASQPPCLTLAPPQELYGGRLAAHESVAGHTMAGVAGGTAEAADQPVLLLIDTAGCDMEEQQEEEGDSKVRAGCEQAGLMASACLPIRQACLWWVQRCNAPGFRLHGSSAAYASFARRPGTLHLLRLLCLPTFEWRKYRLPRLVAPRQWNDGEAGVVMEHVRRLMAAGVAPSDIGIITPYNAQVGGLSDGGICLLACSTAHRGFHCVPLLRPPAVPALLCCS